MVSRDLIECAITAAGNAPSAANQQPWHFVVVSTAERKRAIREAVEAEERAFFASRASEEWREALDPLLIEADKPFLEHAPWLIVCFAQRRGGIEESGSSQNYYVTESVGIACGMLLATLHEAGLATLTHTPTPSGFLRKMCGRPDHERPLLMIVVGHPHPDAVVPTHAIRKKPITQIASWI